MNRHTILLGRILAIPIGLDYSCFLYVRSGRCGSVNELLLIKMIQNPPKAKSWSTKPKLVDSCHANGPKQVRVEGRV
jgi:hypothetical protein